MRELNKKNPNNKGKKVIKKIKRCTHYRCTIKQDSETPRSTKKRIFRFPNVFTIGFRRFRFPTGCAPDVIPIEYHGQVYNLTWEEDFDFEVGLSTKDLSQLGEWVKKKTEN